MFTKPLPHGSWVNLQNYFPMDYMKCLHRKLIFTVPPLIAVPRKKNFLAPDPTCHPYVGEGWKHDFFVQIWTFHLIHYKTLSWKLNYPILPPQGLGVPYMIFLCRS